MIRHATAAEAASGRSLLDALALASSALATDPERRCSELPVP
jgi:hypothetical protein